MGGKNYSKSTELTVKQDGKLFHAYWVCSEKSPTSTEYAVKNLLRLLSMRFKKSPMSTEYGAKKLLFFYFLNIHKRPIKLNFPKRYIVGTNIGSKATTTNL